MTVQSFAPFSWTPLSLADAYTPRPPTRWVVDGLFRASSLSMLFGPPGCLKSLLALDLAACVVAGVDWLPPDPGGTGGETYDVTQGASVLLDFDNGSDTTLERLEAVGRTRNLPQAAPLYAVSMPQPWLDASKIGHAQQLIGWLQGFQNLALVIVDNLAAVSGSADENSSEMVQVLGAFRFVAEQTGAAILLIHHARKASASSKGQNGDSIRGHSSIMAALDLALSVERDDDMVTLEAVKARGNPPDPIGARYTYTHKSGSYDLAEVRFFAAKPAKANRNQDARAAVIDALTKGGSMNQSAIVTTIQKANPKISRYPVRNALEYLVKRGIVCERSGPLKNALIYELGLTP